MLRCFVVPVVTLLSAFCVYGELERHQYEGTLGKTRVGMTVLRDGNKIEGGHYFYQQFLEDIAITGSFENSQVTLTETGGGTFRLQFVGNGSDGGRPLDFENSIGLDGTWTSADGASTYPVSLRGATIRQGDDDGSQYRDITSESPEAFETRVQTFWRAVLRGDKATAVRFISYPLRVNIARGKSKSFRSSAAVLAAWNELFTPALIDKLRDDLPHDMFVRNGAAMLGHGEAWFDAKGLAVLNFP
jgi:hypothetical protein